MTYAKNTAGQIFGIKIQGKSVGNANVGDTFFSDLNITDPKNYTQALQDISQASGRCWLLTDEVNPLHEKFAKETNFICLGPGVWIRETL